MKRSRRWLGNGIRVVTLLVCVLAVFVGISRGQRMPPPPFKPPIIQPPIVVQQPIPIMQPPVMERKCMRCNAVVGTGPTSPNIATCPNCKARLPGGGGSGQEPLFGWWTIVSGVIILLGFGAIAAVLAGVAMVKHFQKASKKAAKKKRVRDRD